ncbi:MAG: sulfatase-like hydrolase/transferase [Kiritimatiellae bacterium]|nr:sulfatase-like hydrolase/transferase [Kiritimatiellia bacterium]
MTRFQMLCGALLAGWVGAAEVAVRPNLLLIFTDDQGWADLGAQGADPHVRTPNLDRLARDGALCTRGYVTAPQCTPSRAGVLTGMYQQRWGVEHNGIRLPLEAVTIAERLREAGYATGMSGKWHLEVERVTEDGRSRNRVSTDHLPHRQGFEEYFCGTMYEYIASHGLDGSPLPDAPRAVSVTNQCRVVTQTEAALGFLRRRADERPMRPWFLYVAYMAPHVPLESPEPWFSATPTNLSRERRQALALLAAIDEGVGRLREQLHRMGADTNTVIFFISDNGAPLGSAWNGSLNLPLRGQKGMLSEGGIRVPFLVAWPGRIPGGQRYEHPVISLDFAATALAAAGLPPPAELDGVNLLPYLCGEVSGAPHDALYWRWTSQAAVLEFPWKFVVIGDRERGLFDVTTPEGEAYDRNRICEYPEIAARLEAKLKDWCATLRPPGLATTSDAHHESLFVEHRIFAGDFEVAAPNAGSARADWMARNGRLVVTNGALTIVPDGDGKGRVFLTRGGLDLAGPVRATLLVRARQGGRAALSWRTKREKDFAPENIVEFDWPATNEWSITSVTLPVRGRLVHVRVFWPRGGEGVELRSIELVPSRGRPQTWQFDRGQ